MRFLIVFLLLSTVALAQPREFRDCPECPLMVAVPPGELLMGVPAGEEEAEGLAPDLRGRSVPQTLIRFQPGFALGKHPVTRAEFLAFSHATGRQPGHSCWHVTRQDNVTSLSFQDRQGLNWREPSFAQTGTEPVICVSWDDAQAYVAWLARETGQAYRLPSEAEWEYAARAGTRGPRWWAGGLSDACANANVRENSVAGFYNFVPNSTYFPCSDGFAHTSPAGSFPANSFGLHDVLGNVWQWTADCWNPTLSGLLVSGAARTSGDCALRVVRGGSWGSNSRFVRAGHRDRATAGYRNTALGFRVARTL